MTLSLYERRTLLDGGTKIVSAHNLFRFPGGESHLNFEPTSSLQIAYVTGADGNDLMGLAMWADAIRRHPSRSKGRMDSVLLLPYLPGARADRGTPLGAKVYADFINSLDIDQVITVDPHSDVAPALYDRLTVVSLDALPVWNMQTMQNYDGVIVPDLGARKRAESVAVKLNLPVYQAMKHRDFATGQLSGFSCETLDADLLARAQRFLIVDDICDGGGTFLGLAEELRSQGVGRENLGLWVTHGIFSQDVVKLSEKFSYIGTTDSHPGSAQTRGSYAGTQFHVISLLNYLINSTVKV